MSPVGTGSNGTAMQHAGLKWESASQPALVLRELRPVAAQIIWELVLAAMEPSGCVLLLFWGLCPPTERDGSYNQRCTLVALRR